MNLRNSAPNRNKSIAVVSALLLGGVAYVLTHDEAPVSGTSAVEQPSRENAYKEMACPTGLDAQTPEQAKLCEQFMYGGRIALVAYGLKPAEATELARLTEQQINVDLGAKVQVDAMLTNEIAEAILEDSTDTCADGSQASQLVSHVATHALKSELTPYDAVIGVTTLPDCSDTDERETLGQFAPGHGQLVDIYQYDPEEPLEAASAAAHEIGHVVGLNHSGLLIPKNTGMLDGTPSVIDLIYEKGVLDLSNIAKTANYAPYGEPCALMGNDWICEHVAEEVGEYVNDGAFNDFPEVNKIQQTYLQWTNEADGHTPASYIDLSSEVASYRVGVSDQPIAVLNILDESISFKTREGEGTGVFDKLVFVPECSAEPAPQSNCLKAYLSTSDMTGTAYLGSMQVYNGPESAQKFTIKLHSQTVTLAFENQKVTISVK